MANFGEKYGLPSDRVKLEEGLKDFWIQKIQLVDSKKKVDMREEGIDGTTKLVRKTYKIAYIDITIEGETEIKKFYSPNKPIVEACINILHDFGKSDGTLKEPMHIDEVKEGISETGKNAYLFFT